MVYIYYLAHPVTLEVRYVGKTKDLKRRLQSHIDYSRCKKKRRKVSDWVLSLLNQGLKPVITMIEETTIEEWPDRERFWIKHFRGLGFNLCNLTDGGESNSGYVYSDALKELRRKARLGWIFPEHVKKSISISLSKKIERSDGKIYDSMKTAIHQSGVPRSTFHRRFHKGIEIKGFKYKWYNQQSK